MRPGSSLPPTAWATLDQLEVLADGEVVVEQRVVGHERQPRAGVLGLGL